jgi:leucyl/phenylalanyl-tRNA---protein transferase
MLQKMSRVLHREIVDPLLLNLFRSKEDAICSVYNTLPVSTESMISNYFQGMLLFGRDPNEKLFWYRKEDVYWQIFKQRVVLLAEDAEIPKAQRRFMRKGFFDSTYNENFDAVIQACQRENRSWINDTLIGHYRTLHERGLAQSLEIYQDGEMVGGLWGIVIGKIFCGMSCFHTVKNAGSMAFAYLVSRMMDGGFEMIDMVMRNAWQGYHTIMISRAEFIQLAVKFSYCNQEDAEAMSA